MGLVIFSDEIYDQILYDGAEHVPVATLVRNTLCATFGGLSKVYRACGLRVGWLSFSGTLREQAKDYLLALDLLASLRLCSNVPGQYAVQTALGGRQSIYDLTKPGGRLYQTRQAIIEGARASAFLDVMAPQGAMYAFMRREARCPAADFDRPALRARPAREEARAGGARAPVSMSPTRTISASPCCRMRRPCMRSSDASRNCCATMSSTPAR
jgi:aspartate/methionine/tyrosine aminotransferase